MDTGFRRAMERKNVRLKLVPKILTVHRFRYKAVQNLLRPPCKAVSGAQASGINPLEKIQTSFYEFSTDY
jgi:hypothetical protein